MLKQTVNKYFTLWFANQLYQRTIILNRASLAYHISAAFSLQMIFINLHLLHFSFVGLKLCYFRTNAIWLVKLMEGFNSYDSEHDNRHYFQEKGIWWEKMFITATAVFIYSTLTPAVSTFPRRVFWLILAVGSVYCRPGGQADSLTSYPVKLLWKPTTKSKHDHSLQPSLSWLLSCRLAGREATRLG